MAEYSIDLTGDRDVKRQLDRVPRAVDLFVENTALDVWGGLRRESPVDEGRLAGSWQLRRVGAHEYRLVSGVDYASIVHEGRGPVEAVNAQALRFEIAGQVIFAKRVRAAPPNRFADRAVESTEHRTDILLRAALARAGVT